MSMIATGALGAVAFQVAASLDQYELDMGRLVDGWFDAGLYAGVADAMDAIQRRSASVPGISVPAVALLIAHSELVHVLWRGGNLHRAIADHAACVQTLRRACLRQFTRQRA